MYVCGSLCVFVDCHQNQKDFYLQHLWMVSDCLEDLCLCGLHAKVDTELCSHEPT